MFNKIHTNERENLFLRLILDEDSVSVQEIADIWTKFNTYVSMSHLKKSNEILHYIMCHKNPPFCNCMKENCEFNQIGGNHGNT